MILRNNAHPRGIDVGPGRGRLVGQDEDAPRQSDGSAQWAHGYFVEVEMPWATCPPDLSGLGHHWPSAVPTQIAGPAWRERKAA
jgi:hypothetical protein